MKTKRVIVLGAGGNCRDIVDAMMDTVYEPVGYLDDDPAKLGIELGGVRVLGPLASAQDHGDCLFVNGINGTKLTARKKELLAGLAIPAERFATIVHPSAAVSRMARLGVGSVILQNVSICSEAAVGDHAMVLPSSVVSHDTIVGDYCYLTPGVVLAGYVRLGEAVYMGAGSTVMCRVEIGDRAIVGMGSVVLEDVPEDSVVVGNPARPLKK
jgi:sugar O-acyltransferase (sialic acid O-acetyltransferase NeuD family)